MKLKYTFKHELAADERTHEHRQIILQKKFLKKLYMEWYAYFKSKIQDLPDGKIIEIGSGGGFIKDQIPHVITSDIIPFPWTDLTFSALKMPFEEDEVSAILMIDTFHHIPDSGLFLQEVNRILKPGGKMIMIEPAASSWGKFIYKNFHHEPFEIDGDWTIPSSGPLTGANGALPWIVFERDKELFQNKFPSLQINSINYHSPFRYLVSGGVSFKGIFPSFTFPAFRFFDKTMSSLSKEVSMFMTVEVEKT
jgi:SAM-dependent methyltransferase